MTRPNLLDSDLLTALESARLREQLRREIEARLRAQGGITLTIPKVKAQSAPITGLDAPTPTTRVTATPEQQAEIVESVLRQLLVLAGKAQEAWADRRISWAEGAALGTLLITSVSTAVMTAAPMVQDADARALVLLVYGVLFDQFIRPMLPGWLQPFAGMLRDQAPRLLEDIYWSVVRRMKPVAVQ